MKRIRQENINTQPFWDMVWKAEHPWKIGRDISMARAEAMAEKIGAGASVLDVGGGRGELAEWMQKRTGCRVTLVDISPYAAEEAGKRGIAAHAASCLNLPFIDEMFDAAYSGELLEHIDSPHEMVAEMARVTKPDGGLILSTPFQDAYAHDKQHVWSFGTDDVRSMLEPFGATDTRRVENWIVAYCKKQVSGIRD